MDNKIITDELFIKKLKFYIAGSQLGKGYELVCSVGTINYYLCTDGSIREFAWLYHKDVAAYATKELAQEALDRFNNKEIVMKKKDLTSGMVLTIEDEFGAVKDYTVVLGHEYGDICIRGSSYLALKVFNDTLDDSGRNFGTYKVLKVCRSNSVSDFHSTDTSKFKVLWTRPVPVTTMTIAEIQKKLGIDNLHITE